VLDELNSKNLKDGVPIDEEAEPADGRRNGLILPGAKRGDDGSRSSRVEVLTLQVAFSSTGREWATISGEGLHVYSLDDDLIFDPISLTEAITPKTIFQKLYSGDYGLALRMAIQLNEFDLVRTCLEKIPFRHISVVVRFVGPQNVEKLCHHLATMLEESPHLEFYMQWCQQLLLIHGRYLEQNRGSVMRGLRTLHKAVQTRYEEVKTVSTENRYTLEFLETVSSRKKKLSLSK